MTLIEGCLEYTGWARPWAVSTDNRAADLSTQFWAVASRLKDKPAKMECGRDRFALFADPASDYRLEFQEVGEGIILHKPAPMWGISNVLSYAEAILCNLNGREIIASIEDGKIDIFANPAEDVPAVKYQGSGNMSRIPDGMEKAICRAGEAECCIFLTAGSAGFECAKFSGGLARLLLERKAAGTMRASRIGNCRNIGREDA